MIYAVIDRFEGDYAVLELEDLKMINIKRNEIPLEAKEGDVLVLGEGKIHIDLNETIRRREEIRKLTEDMWK